MKTYLCINNAIIAGENPFFPIYVAFWGELSILPYMSVFHLLEALGWNHFACSHLLTSAQVVSQGAIGKQKDNHFYMWWITHAHTWISFYDYE